MTKSIFAWFKCALLAMLALFLPISAASEQKDDFQPTVVRLFDHIPARAVANAQLLGNVQTDTHVPLTFTLPLRNQEALETLISRIHDPADELYGKYLTSEQFVEQFAPTQEDYDKVVEYAKSAGLEVVATHPNRLLVNVKAPVRDVESAFNLQLNHYQLPSGRKFYAPNNNPEVPASIASIISGVVGLDNQAVWRPYHRKLEAAQTPNAMALASPSGPGGGFAPKDISTAYNLSSVGAQGDNQTIALFQLAGYQASDINAYASYFGLPTAQLTNVIVDGGSQTNSVEVAIDIELALALAPKSRIYVYEGPNSNQGVIDTYNRIATDNIAKQVSTSWGLGEDLVDSQTIQSQNAIFMQMAAQGQTIYAAAGDSGALDDYPVNGSQTPVVDDPASQPYVVGVGGTHLTVDANTGAYIGETVWNDGLGNGAGGGGVSTVWTIPSWQSNVATVASKTNRNVPDVALNSDGNSGYAIYYNGQWSIYGGTSCAAPLWAAFTACVNQKLQAAGSPVLGFANPTFYKIGESPAYTTTFHDITQGNNLVYNAAVGYDNASGWGSFNGANLLASLTNSTIPPVSSAHLNITMKHKEPFTRGRSGSYTLFIWNQGTGSTSGPVNVVVTLPQGLRYSSASATGPGWTLNQNTLTFTQNSSLPAGYGYPTLTLNVSVASNAPHTVTPTATVSGGGSTATTVSNLTTIQ